MLLNCAFPFHQIAKQVRALLICGFLLLLWGVAQAQTQVLGGPAANKAKGQVVSTGQVQATLQVYAPKGLVAGETFWLGLQIQHQPQWHTYWRNPGDSGLATELQWQLPDGLTSGNIIWPAPQKIPVGSMANYGYEGSVLLVTPVQVGPKFKASASETDITVQLRASWLVCKQNAFHKKVSFWCGCLSKAARSRPQRLSKPHFQTKRNRSKAIIRP